MTPLNLFLGPYGTLAKWGVMALLVAAAGAWCWQKGNEHGTQKLITYQGEQAAAGARLTAARERVVTQVVTKWRTRVETIEKQGETIVKEVPIYVTKTDDAGCRIPVGFVREYDAAAANRPDPGTPGPADREDSGIPLSVLAATDAYNLTLGHRWKARAEQCVEIYNAVRNAR